MHTVVPLQRDAATWLRKPGRIWLSWSIFNPNGPTVSCVGLRDTEQSGRAEVFYRWQHFLGGEDYSLGQVNTQAADAREQLAAVFTGAFALRPGQGLQRFAMVTCIPSLVVSNVEEDWLPVLRACLEGSAAIQAADWGRERYLLGKYGNRLFDRAGEELREAYEGMRREHDAKAERDPEITERLQHMFSVYRQVPTFADWEPGRYVSRGIQAGDFETWWNAVTALEFWPPATQQLARAWENTGRQSTLPHRTPMAEVRDFFAAYGMPIFSPMAGPGRA
ncbi:MAG: hypothetical protein PVI87_04225 [Gammaproteobacteria bacterium]|jgi:hypothetical protein